MTGVLSFLQQSGNSSKTYSEWLNSAAGKYVGKQPQLAATNDTTAQAEFVDQHSPCAGWTNISFMVLLLHVCLTNVSKNPPKQPKQADNSWRSELG